MLPWRFLPALGAVAILLSVIGVPRISNDSVLGGGPVWRGSRIAFREGDELWFNLKAESILAISNLPATDSRGTSSGEGLTTISGLLFAKVIEKSTLGALVGLQLLKVTCPEETLDNTGCRDVYGAPFMATITPEGVWTRYAFSSTLSFSEEKKVRGLFDWFSCSLTGQGKRGKWSTHERDTTGVAAVEYSTRDEQEFLRRRVEYLVLSDAPGIINSGSFPHSLHTITLSPSRSWIQSIRIRERAQFFQNGVERYLVSSNVSLEGTDSHAKTPDWARFNARELKSFLADGPKRSMSRVAEARAREAVANSSAEPNDLGRILSALRGELRPAETLTRCREVTEYLRHYVGGLARLGVVLKDPLVDPLMASRLIYSLQNLDTPEVQKTLLKLAEDNQAGRGVRKGALIALGFTKITEQTENRLWEMADSSQVPNAALSNEMALLTLGRAARTLLVVDRERSKKIVDVLLERLERSLRSGRLSDADALYFALGSTGSPHAIGALETGIFSKREEVRVAAASGLASFGEIDHPERIALRMLEEDHPRVRNELIETLLESKLSEESFHTVAKAFVHETDSKTRMAMARYLVKTAEEFPQQRSHLRTLLRVEKNAEVAQVLGESGHAWR